MCFLAMLLASMLCMNHVADGGRQVACIGLACTSSVASGRQGCDACKIQESTVLQVNSLSGGERRRLQLAAVLVEKPNLLILDEPTNDLDLQTVEVVEELLSEYKGCLLVVSHDRTFMENLADRLFVVSGDGLVRLYDGLYSEVKSAVSQTA